MSRINDIFHNGTPADIDLGGWLSDILDDPNACEEFKESIKEWMKQFETHETSSLKKIEELEKNDFLLTCLENAGVNNWDGYFYALTEFYSKYKN